MEASNNQSLWYLENIDVTGIFCPKKIGSQQEILPHREFVKNQIIYLPDEYADRIFLLLEGRVKIITHGDKNKAITKTILSKGQVFGLLSIIGEERRRDFAIALEDSKACVITVEEMKGLLRDYKGLEFFLMKIMGSRMLDMERRLESFVFKSSRTRVIEFLKELAEKKGRRVGYEMLVKPFMTHQEIADYTATSRQTATTVLNELRRKNILIFSRWRMLVRDMEALEKEAMLESV